MKKKFSPIGRQKIKLAINNYFIKQYADQTNYKINHGKHVRNFDKISRKFRDIMLDHSITNLALINGGHKASDILTDLGFEGAEINTKELITLSLIAMRVQVFISLLESTNISKSVKKRLLNRFIYRLLPLKDNTNTADMQSLLSKMIYGQNKGNNIN